MSALVQDATVYQGEYRILRCTIWADAAKTQRKSLVNASVEYRIGRKDTTHLVLRVTQTPNAAGSVVVVTDPTNGVIQIVLRQADTAALEPRQYSQQVLVIDSSGKINVVTDGFLVVGETLPST